MLVSQRDDHKRNFSRTRDLAIALAAALPPASSFPEFGPSLLRFYAVESGLKFLLNRVEKVPFTYEVSEHGAILDATPGFPAKVESYSHDLVRMLSRLKVSAATIPIPSGPFKVIGGYNGGQEFEIKGAHEAWRYGLNTDPSDQAALEEFLQKIILYIEGEI
ncbi:hypothetical protein [Janthinobacterium sp. RA13]|uniref:hypothetical protein n=1 Tax=Janthinobacterium sp. RA13 TaxID=1502762 RepID=UPI0012699791|nr:hypothetical protein [Janthinobacterium sp. RA13]